MDPGYVAAGRVVAPWGVRGDLKVEPLAGPPSPLIAGRDVRVAGQTRTVEHCRRRGSLLHLKLSGVDDREAALALRDQYIEVAESGLAPLEPGQYYRFQLIGLEVRASDGESLGRLDRVLTTPGNDVFVVQGPRGELLIPAVDDIVLDVDIEAGTMTVEVVPGLLPPEREG